LRPETLVGDQKRKHLRDLLEQCRDLPGEVWECGVYQGGTAWVLEKFSKKNQTLRLFDSWEGLPEPHEKDNAHYKGCFGDVDYERVKSWFVDCPHVQFHKGWIPDTFVGLEHCRICFAHIDLDFYQSYLDSLNFIYPRLLPGGIIVFDDYGAPQCKGATAAVDEFFEGKEAVQHRGSEQRSHFIQKDQG
jgi:O-methyltransferase